METASNKQRRGSFDFGVTNPRLVGPKRTFKFSLYKVMAMRAASYVCELRPALNVPTFSCPLLGVENLGGPMAQLHGGRTLLSLRLKRMAERCACWWIRGEGDTLIQGRNINANLTNKIIVLSLAPW